jgi:hypothetical protein
MEIDSGDCPNYYHRHRPEEGLWALSHSKFGLDVTALIGSWYDLQQCRGPRIHQALLARGINISQRNVTYLIGCYKQLVKGPHEQLKVKLQEQGHVLLAIDKLQPDDRHRALWVIRDCLSAEVLLCQGRSTGSCTF